MTKNVTITLLFTIFVNINLLAQKDWEKSIEKNGITVYLRDSDKTPFKEVLATIVIDAKLSSIVYLIRDISNHENWVYANKKTKILKDIDDFNWIAYNISEAPWPVTDREVITKNSIVQNNDLSVKIQLKCYSNFLPENDDYVRIKYLDSYWQLTPLEKNKTSVKLKITLNLGGGIPAWVVNMVIDNAPYETMNGFREQLKKPLYKNAEVPYIKNF
jgi:ribosome-associated toxin RatA of RatAB toxin-antitoxin module